MVPIPVALWHEQQADELFASLLGQSLQPAVADVEVSNGVTNGMAEDVAPLRIFG